MKRRFFSLGLAFVMLFALAGAFGCSRPVPNPCGYDPCICYGLFSSELLILQDRFDVLYAEAENCGDNDCKDLRAQVTELGHDIVYLEFRFDGRFVGLMNAVDELLRDLTKLRAELDMPIEFEYHVFTVGICNKQYRPSTIIKKELCLIPYINHWQEIDIYNNYVEYINFLEINYLDAFFNTHYLVIIRISIHGSERLNPLEITNEGVIYINTTVGAGTAIIWEVNFLIEFPRYFRPYLLRVNHDGYIFYVS